MAERKQNAEYGVAASKEELERSGYRLPPSFFVTPSPDGSGEPSEAEVKADAEAKNAAPVTENKASVPVTDSKASRRRKK